jgi:hypothetical protein
MTTLHDASRNRLFMAIAALVALAATGLLAVSWLTARREDNSQELLRQAVGTDAARPRFVTGKTTRVEGTSSSGRVIQGELTTLKSATGRTVGFVPRLQQPLKDGETASLKLPGGGQIVIQGPPPGASFPSTFTPPRSRP